MYEDFYGLHEKPFSITPDPQFLFLSRNHRSALEHLTYGIEQKEGFILITGDVGSGKTMICRYLLERMNQKTKTALILNPLMSEEELLQSIIFDFGLTTSSTTRKELIDKLNQFLLDCSAGGETVVLIIDEAQNLSIPVLEQVRILSNLETEKEKLLQIILVGQVELQEKLNLPKLRQLNQRISIRYHLSHLNQDEISRYIEHRLTVAGSSGGITFTKGALRTVFQYSGGVPRLINLICDRALLAGYTSQSNRITYQLVKRSIESLGRDKEISEPFNFFTKGKVISFAVVFFIMGLLFSMLFQGEISRFFTSRSTPGKTEAPSQSTNVVQETRSDSLNTKSPVPGKEHTTDISLPYTIQIGSFAKEDSASARVTVRMLEGLNLGYKVYVSRVELPKNQEVRVWYRVLIGEFETEAEAMSIATKLKLHKEIPHTLVVSKSFAFGSGELK
ncbi:MAG: AAA family ATPase [Candidatus Latescibacter sp.]|nr:AAA family ATPase [Candidatus Latescibacter sp.]